MRRRIWKGDILIADIEIHSRRLNAKEVITPKKEVTILHSRSQMEQQNCLGEITLEAGNNL